MPRASSDDGFESRPQAEFAEPSPTAPLESQALDAVVRATLESADADQRVTPEEIEALKAVARRLGPVPLSFDPVAIALVEAIVQVNYGQLGREPEVWRSAAGKIARLLFDSPTARSRLEVLWRQLVESTS